MIDELYRRINESASFLELNIDLSEFAAYAFDRELTENDLTIVAGLMDYLKAKKNENVVTTLLNTSRLPRKEPKTFENFDFSLVKGDVDSLQSLKTLSAVYARRNLAFIGPQGVGKTHLAMAYGRECCKNGMKTYFLKATELNHKFKEARKCGKEDAAIDYLVKPTCLIIDEVGRCVFDKENTRMFFNMIDRRCSKEVPNTMIFTSNMNPDKWGEYFTEDSSLVCALDRLFDVATVYLIKGNSYRGKKCETISLSVGNTLPTLK